MVFWASSLLGLPPLFIFYSPLCLFLWAWVLWFFGPQHSFIFYFGYFRASPAESPNFCTIWRIYSDFYLLVTYFFKYTSNRFSIPFSISFKYYFFIHYLFFLTTTYLPTFFYSTSNYYNRKKAFEEWTLAHQTWWATVHEPKKKI